MRKIVHYDPATLDPDVLHTFKTFWANVPHVFENGVLNLNALMNELSDYAEIMNEVATVYMEVTGGRVSKQNTAASVVVEFYREEVQQAYQNGWRESREDCAAIAKDGGMHYTLEQDIRDAIAHAILEDSEE